MECVHQTQPDLSTSGRGSTLGAEVVSGARNAPILVADPVPALCSEADARSWADQVLLI